MKTVLITGASRGVGKALATKFLNSGWKVVAIARDGDALSELKKVHPENAYIYSVDLLDDDAVGVFIDRLKSDGIKLDALVANAGAIVNKPFVEISSAELARVYQVNVFSVFGLIQKCLPLYKENCHTVTISSMGGFQGSMKFPGLTAYSSSKAAVASLTECLQQEFSETTYAFNCICLGAVQTEMLESAFPGYRAPMSPEGMAEYLFEFTSTGWKWFRGKILPASISTP